MILYQDSSSIVKRYVEDEKGISETRQAVEQADFLATSLLSYAEVRAAFARVKREVRASADDYRRILEALQRDWRPYRKVNVSPFLVRLAGDLAEKHTLRGYDAVHLASALILRDSVPDGLTISTWDLDLGRAAAAEGLSLAHEVET